MFKSLRKTGWEHECVCFSDRIWDFPEELNVQTIVLPHSPSMKCHAFSSLNLEEDDVFIFADSDMLFVRNPEELPELEEKQVSVTQTGLPLKNFEFNTCYMTENEIRNIPITQGCLNTGFVIIPGGEIGSKFCEIWSNFHSSVRGEFEEPEINIIRDQPAMETLVLRNQLSVNKLPFEYMFFPSLARKKTYSENCVVLHFTGYPYNLSGKQRLIEAMKRAIVEI